MTPLQHDEVEELLGAYALDAVDPDEAAAVEAHLRTCPRCRAEVEQHQEVASLLVSGSAEPPAGVWDRIAADLGEIPPPMPIEVALGRRRRPGRVLAGLAAAAAVVVLAVLGSVVVDQRSEVRELRAAVEADRALALALDDPDTQVVTLGGTDPDVVARAVVTDEGEGVLLAGGLPALDEDETYQLWGLQGDDAVSLGLLGSTPDQEPFRVAAPTEALAVSREPAGGSVAPTTDPLVSGALT
jgi:anti-sigma-K factor RskA